ncbi:MAG: OmpH family outer membrane protein [Spirochaetes bacterium]|nr:OmpH family outer membrane protein [Spirochaetota bacterium]
MLKRITITCMVILFAFSLSYARKAERLTKIGVVDLSKVFEGSEGKKMAEEHLEKLKEEMEKKKKEKEEEIEKLKEDYEDDKGEMDDKQKETKHLEIQRKLMELREFIEKSNKKLADEEEKLLEPLIKDIKDVIKAVSIKYAYNIILDKSTYVLYVDKDYDITDEVLEELKAKYKK